MTARVQRRVWPAVLLSLFSLCLQAQTRTDSLNRLLFGRWEVVGYSEQGVQVDKRAPALPQAIHVYDHVRRQRAEQWYGYYEYDELSRRENRAFERWQDRDSTIEVNRLTQVISMPYYAVFFPDGTLSLYNKDKTSGQIYFPEARHFSFEPASMSIDIYQPGGYGVQWQAQILMLTAERMQLFLPEEAELVELVKTVYALP